MYVCAWGEFDCQKGWIEGERGEVRLWPEKG